MDVNANRRSWMKLRARGGWLSRAWDLGQHLRPASASAGQLFVVGTETFDPWHLSAHLADEARLCGLPSMRPTLLRWRPPQSAPPHLAHTVAELVEAGRHKAVLVVAPNPVSPEMLERLSDARRRGASLLAVTAGQRELNELAHDAVTIPGNVGSDDLTGDDFSLATHLVTVSAGTKARSRRT